MKVATITKPVKNLWGRSEKSMTTSTMFSCCYSSTIKPASHSSVFRPSLRSISSSSFHLRPKSRNFISLNESSSFPGNSISINTRNLCVVSASKSDNGSQESSFQGAESFFRSVLASMEKVYLNRNPTAKQILELVQSVDSNQICYDHLAFRTFGVNGYGIDSMAKFFLDFGYEPRDELRFPAKKLKALWFSPPSVPLPDGGRDTNGPLPRIFMSKLLVDQMSTQTQLLQVLRDHPDSLPSILF